MKDVLIDTAGFWAVRFAARIAQVLPERAALFLGGAFGQTAFYFSPRRHQAYADLKAAFGESWTPQKRWRTIRSHYRHIGQSAVELLRFPLLDLSKVHENVEIRHFERFQKAVGEGRGVLLLTAHLGNWELLQIVSSLLGKPIHALMREQKHSRLNALLNDFRQIKGSRVVRNRGMDLRGLVRALKNGDLVGVLADQSAGKSGGLILPFFNRKTTVPTGSFEIASRTGALLLPAFISRKADGKHLIQVEEPIECPPHEKDAARFEKPLREYLKLVEKHVRDFPDQWLWAKKRWKYSWTKRLVILSDGKPGHVKQSQAIAQAFQAMDSQYGRPGMEYPLETIQVRYKSSWHRKIFYLLAFFMTPWIQGRLSLLRPFFDFETSAALEKAKADFVISTGSSLVPVNLCLAKENRSKSVVVMRPPFPYDLCRYDLAVIPEHDLGRVPEQSIRLLLTPSAPNAQGSMDTADALTSEISGRGKIDAGIFLGGPTRDYEMSGQAVKSLFEALERAENAPDYAATTSRRTPEEVCRYLKEESIHWTQCRKLIVASEDTRSGVVECMIKMAKFLVVTEDSISMVSEAVSSGKSVIVFASGDTSKLPRKHERFLNLLEQRKAIVRADAGNIAEKLALVQGMVPPVIAEQEKESLRKKLQEIL